MRTDILVIGGGSAGAVVAGRLARLTGRQVLLVEAGPRDWHPFFHVPLMTGHLASSPSSTWRRRTQMEPATCDRSVEWPQGKVLGGSSAINGMVWMRGRPSDYAGWAEATGDSGWSWDAVAPLFEAIEEEVGLTRHGGGSPLFDAFLAACREAGQPATQDFNRAPFEGAGRFSHSIRGGCRRSAARAFLAKAPRNLSILTGWRAIRLQMDGNRATGAVLQRGAQRIAVGAKETVVSAGAVNSPALLMHSGIGDPDVLSRAGVALRVPSPSVGRNLQDHFGGRVSATCPQPVTLADVTYVDRAAWAFLAAWATGRGIAAASPFGAGCLLRSFRDCGEPDLEAVFIPALTTAKLRGPSFLGGAQHGYTCAVYPLRPKSRGTVSIVSADPLIEPRIRPGYFSDAHDRVLARQGLRLVREIVAQPAFAPFRGVELLPGAAAESDEALDAVLRASASTAFHPVGTCRMGADRDAVLTPDLKVRGIHGLRVADASVMPAITSGNTMAPAMLIGYRCAQIMASETADT